MEAMNLFFFSLVDIVSDLRIEIFVIEINQRVIGHDTLNGWVRREICSLWHSDITLHGQTWQGAKSIFGDGSINLRQDRNETTMSNFYYYLPLSSRLLHNLDSARLRVQFSSVLIGLP